MEETAGHRIKRFREHKQLTPTQFSEATGVRYSTLKTMEGGGGVSGASLVKISRAFPDLNEGWVLTGCGEMFKGGRELSPVAPDTELPTRSTVPVRQLPQMAATVGDVVLRKDYDQLRNDYEWLKERYEELMETHRKPLVTSEQPRNLMRSMVPELCRQEAHTATANRNNMRGALGGLSVELAPALAS